MMYCPRCGEQLADEAMFCSKCGHCITDETPTISNGSGILTMDDFTEKRFLERALTGKFTVLEELGRGGFGVVFLSHDVRLNRKVAIKALHLSKASDQSLVKRFIKEAQLSAALEHPNIVRIYNIDSAGAVHYFIMEYIEGPNLREYIVDSGAISPFETVVLCRPILQAIAFAHSRGIIHRDIKPHNIILKRNETPVVTDFGIAKALDSEATALTSGAIGSPHYIAPEQLRNEAVDARTDQYSMGIMMFEMLTGQLPFTGSGFSLIHQQLNETAPQLRQINPSIPLELSAVVQKMLSKQKEDRYPSSEEVLRALDEIDPGLLPRNTDGVITVGSALDKSISDLIFQIKDAMDKQELDRAIRLCEQGKNIAPEHLEIVYYLQQAQAKKDAVNRAKKFKNEGIQQFHARHYAEAIESWYKAYVLNETDQEIQEFIAQAQKAQQEYNEAESIFKQAVTLFDAKAYTDSLGKFKKVKEIVPDFPSLEEYIVRAESAEAQSTELERWMIEAEKHFHLKQYHESIDVYKKVLEMDPLRTEAREGMERVIRELRKHQDIQRLLEKSAKYEARGNFDKAIEILNHIRVLDPENNIEYAKLISAVKRRKMKKLPEPSKIGTLPHSVAAREAKISRPDSVDASHGGGKSPSEPPEQPADRGGGVRRHGSLWFFAGVALTAIIAGWIMVSMGVIGSRKNGTPPEEFTPLPAKTAPVIVVPVGTPSPDAAMGSPAMITTETPHVIEPRETATPVRRRTETPVPDTRPRPATPTPMPAVEPPSPSPKPRLEPTPVPVAKESEQDRKRLQEAENLIQKKDLRAALNILQAIILDHPDHQAANQYIREIQKSLQQAVSTFAAMVRSYEAGKYKDAETYLERLESQDPHYPEIAEWKVRINLALHSPATDQAPQIISLEAPQTVKPQFAARVSVTVDSEEGVRHLVLYYRQHGKGRWLREVFSDLPAGRNHRVFIIPAKRVTRRGLEIFVEMVDKNGKKTNKFTNKQPFVIPAEK